MPTTAMYTDKIDNYKVANQFGSISKSHECGIQQIRDQSICHNHHFKVLDLGVGNGEFLKKLQHCLPKAKFTGIDLSLKRLNIAKNKLDLKALECSATEADQFVPHYSQDLVLAHFINAYIPINTLFNQAKLLTKPNGYFSLITTTYESFPIAQQCLADFIAEGTLASSVVGHYYKAILKNSTVASGEGELLRAFSENHFKIIKHDRLEIPICINTIDELIRFGIEGTWFLNSIAIRMLPKNFLLFRLKKLFNNIFTFPYHDTHIIDVVLAEK